jgi:hypothetical protein
MVRLLRRANSRDGNFEGGWKDRPDSSFDNMDADAGIACAGLMAWTHSACCLFGKQPNPDDMARLIDHPAEQLTIATILAARTEGKGLKAIAGLLKAAGIPCRGEHWHHTTVRSILRRAGQLAEAS